MRQHKTQRKKGASNTCMRGHGHVAAIRTRTQKVHGGNSLHAGQSLFPGWQAYVVSASHAVPWPDCGVVTAFVRSCSQEAVQSPAVGAAETTQFTSGKSDSVDGRNIVCMFVICV